MLEWNEMEREDSNASDGSDDNDDDDRPSDDDTNGGKPSQQPPQYDPRDSTGSDYYGGGGDDGSNGSGAAPAQSGFFQFQLSQFNVIDSGSQSSDGNQHINPNCASQSDQQLQQPVLESRAKRSFTESTHECSMQGKLDWTIRDNKDALAGDELSFAMKLQDQTDMILHGTEENRNLEHNYWKRAHVTIAKVDATIPATTTNARQEDDSGSQSSVNATLRSTDRDRRPSAEDLDSRSLLALRASTTSPVSKSASVNQSTHKTSTSLQNFLSIKLLGAGGFSTVDEVIHRGTNLRVGRKTLKNRDASAIEELKKEVDILQKLRHPHVIRFLGTYAKGDKLSILVSPVAETTLALWLERSSVQRPSNLVDIVVKMFGCLASSVRYLHEQRPVLKHMDIKPQNILIVDGDQDFPHVVLSDFGISSSEDQANKQAMPITRQYIAPESFDGLTRKRAADIWSLGCVFAEMASVSFSSGNTGWLGFRKEFSGRGGKYYWQDVPAVQARLSSFLEDATTTTEGTVVRALKAMLASEPTKRPDAASLTMIFTPAPCCLNWPNDKAIYPSPHEELDGLQTLGSEDGIDCCAEHCVHIGATDTCGQEQFGARTWLDDCSQSHEACRILTSSDVKTLPTRLIDVRPDDQLMSHVRVVDSKSIEQTTDQVDYVALSHVWKPTQFVLSEDSISGLQSGLPLQMLPGDINTAISTARSLGYRYVWLDSLCILQDSEEDKRRECAMMASVFRNAALTVVLDQLTDSTSRDKLSSATTDQNLFTNHQHVSRGSTDGHLPASASLPAIDFSTSGFAWDTRAWVLQERLLSRRFLHLGEQMYWECNTLKASETFPRGLSPLVWEKVHSRSDDRRPATRQASTAIKVATTSTHEHTPRPSSPTRLRDCQWIKKEGDGIGDSMEAAQTTLQLGGTTSAHTRASNISTGGLPTTRDSAPEKRSFTVSDASLKHNFTPHALSTRTTKAPLSSDRDHNHNIANTLAKNTSLGVVDRAGRENGRKDIASGGQLHFGRSVDLGSGVLRGYEGQAKKWIGDAAAKGMD